LILAESGFLQLLDRPVLTDEYLKLVVILNFAFVDLTNSTQYELFAERSKALGSGPVAESFPG